MAKGSVPELAGWLTGFALFTFIVPGILILSLPPGLRPAGIATLSATPIIEFVAIGVGMGMGIHPVISFLLTVLPCTGICMVVVGLVGFFADSSERARGFLEKVQRKMEKYPRLKKHGAASNFFFVVLLGIYIGPGVSIIMGWPRARSVAFMAAGICTITFLIGLAAYGIIELFFI